MVHCFDRKNDLLVRQSVVRLLYVRKWFSILWHGLCKALLSGLTNKSAFDLQILVLNFNGVT